MCTRDLPQQAPNDGSTDSRANPAVGVRA